CPFILSALSAHLLRRSLRHLSLPSPPSPAPLQHPPLPLLTRLLLPLLTAHHSPSHRCDVASTFLDALATQLRSVPEEVVDRLGLRRVKELFPREEGGRKHTDPVQPAMAEPVAMPVEPEPLSTGAVGAQKAAAPGFFPTDGSIPLSLSFSPPAPAPAPAPTLALPPPPPPPAEPPAPASAFAPPRRPSAPASHLPEGLDFLPASTSSSSSSLAINGQAGGGAGVGAALGAAEEEDAALWWMQSEILALPDDWGWGNEGAFSTAASMGGVAGTVGVNGGVGAGGGEEGEVDMLDEEYEEEEGEGSEYVGE
ncbi:hypothetical protein JCM6882_003418, partial [Rhodosporidiobolus microsporus]